MVESGMSNSDNSPRRLTEGPIVALVDTSDASDWVVRHAGIVASERKAGVVLVLIRPMGIVGSAGVFAPDAVQVLRDGWNVTEMIVLSRSISLLDPLEVPWRVEVRSGRPVRELVRVAKQCGAKAIVATWGDRPCDRWMLKANGRLRRWPHAVEVVRIPE